MEKCLSSSNLKFDGINLQTFVANDKSHIFSAFHNKPTFLNIACKPYICKVSSD